MGSIQNSATSPTLAAQSNSNSQALIQSTASQIKSLQPQVTAAASQVQAATATVQADYAALAADPTNKDLQTKLTTDLAALQQANSSLESLSAQLASLLKQLPALISAAKTQDASANAQRSTQANSAQQDADAAAAADEAEQALNNASDVATAAKQALAKKTSRDSYTTSATSQSSAAGGLSESVSDSSSPLAKSASGSQLDAKSVLSSNGIQVTPDLKTWLSKQLGSEFNDNMFQNAMDMLNKGKDDGSSDSSASGKSAGKAKGASKVAAGSLGSAAGSSSVGTLGAGANSAIPSSFTNNTSSSGGIISSSGSSTSAGTLGFAVSGGTSPDGQAAVNPSNLSPNEILMLVMLEATDELNKEMEGMAQQLQKATSQKTVLRGQLNNINGQIKYSTNLSNSDAQNNATLKAQSSNVQNDLDSIGDDTQEMQLRLQNLMQMQQQFIQAVSNVSKNLNDTSMSILRHIGS